MPTTAEQTVRELTLAHPAAARVFEAFGIDYCCGGNRSLRAACATANVPLETVIGKLEAPATPPEPAVPYDTPLGELTQHIVQRHHGYVRHQSPRIHGLLLKVVEKHGGAHPELSELKALFTVLDEELAGHMMKEERILFPYIEALASGARPGACFGSVESPISVMIADHEQAGEVLARMRALSSGYQAPADACPTFQALYRALEEFERDLHWHVHLENNILFPRAIEADRKHRALASSHQ